MDFVIMPVNLQFLGFSTSDFPTLFSSRHQHVQLLSLNDHLARCSQTLMLSAECQC